MDGRDCDRCKYGQLPDGTACSCSFGAVFQRYLDDLARQMDGHGRPLGLDIIPARYRGNTAADLVTLFQGDAQKLATLKRVGAWARMTWAEQKVHSMFLWGPVGTGKTTVAMFALSQFLKSGHAARWVYWSEWITQVDALDFQEGNAEVLELTKVPVLLLDDLGSQDRVDSRGDLAPETNKRQDTVRTILNTRMTKGVPTIITTNLSPEQFGIVWGERVASRVAEDFWIESVTGADLRLSVGVNK